MADYKPGDVANGHILVEGEGWVPLAVYNARNPAMQAAPSPLPADRIQPRGQTPSGSPWYRQTWFIALAAGVLGLFVGGAFGAAGSTETAQPDPTSSTEYRELSDQLADAQAELADAEAALGDLPATQQQLEDDQQALADGQAQLKQGQKKLAQEAKRLAKREKAVGIAEDQVAANTVGGDGIYKVGTDMKPGTYKTSGKRGCYYAVLNSTDTFDIAVNGNVDGPAYATVAPGQYFEVTRCADWVLQR